MDEQEKMMELIENIIKKQRELNKLKKDANMLMKRMKKK